MRAPLPVLALLLAVQPAVAQAPAFRDSLLDRMIGEWVLEGTIAGAHTTHDVSFAWVLGHQYVRLHEVARERDAEGKPAYEAIVFIGWDEPSQRYACLWLDSTGGGGLRGDAIGYGAADADSIPFRFRFPDGSIFHNTFAYSRETDTWEWHLDGEADGGLRPFARVTLSRKP